MKSHNSINCGQDLPSNQAIIEWVGALSANLRHTKQRQLLLCQGTREWCLSLLPVIAEFYHPLQLSNKSDMPNAIAFSTAENLLGQEFDCVIYDQYCGLNIDVLCMASGLIRGSGLLVLLRPLDLSRIDDRYGEWQGRQGKNSYFLQYLDKRFMQSRAVARLHQYASPEELKNLPLSPMATLEHEVTREQHLVLNAMKRWMEDKKQSVFLLTADRGRGKSFALGIFARTFQQSKKIIVTANSKAQLGVLLKNLDAGNNRVQFVAPDEIIRQQARIDCLIIDEAAMLPNSMLQRFLELADKLVLATTTGGYEGTGQGFLLKFMAQFNAHRYLHYQLYEPVRWGNNDLLEQLFNETLFLKSEQAELLDERNDALIQPVTREQFSEDTGLLKDVYGLLVSAHYRTRPSDMRQLMEDENQRIVIATIGRQVIGVLLLNLEGGLQPALCHQIFLGKRRPQGHLFAQMITSQAGIRDFARFRGFRIQRIAVAEKYRRKGTGRLLIEEARRMVKQDGLDYLSSSFALDATMALFWKKLGFDLIHIGSGKGKSTGRQTVAVISSSSEIINRSVQPLIDKLKNHLAVYLLTYCGDMLWSDVLVLLQMLEINYRLNALEEDEISSFVEGFRGFELSQVTLQRLLISTLYVDVGLTLAQQRLLIEKVLLNKNWQELEVFAAGTGRKQLTQSMRQSIRKCYEYDQARKNK